MRVTKIVVLSLWACLILSACQQTQALPTARSMESAQTDVAQTQAALPTPTPTATARFEFPPTFTPTPFDTPQPTQVPAQAQSSNSHLYYLYNDDSIAVVNADGSNNSIVVTLGVGQSISEYALSPDHTRIAFVAPGAGSGREVYVSDISGSSIQKLSCLGYADVRGVTWTPDGTQIVFFAAPTSADAGDIYIMQSANGQGCPNSNSLRILAPIQARDFRSMTFNRPGTMLYYAGGGGSIFIWDMVTNARYLASAEPAFGPDAAPRQNPVTDELVFLRQSANGSVNIGALSRIEDSTIVPQPPTQRLGDTYEESLLDLRWSEDGTLLLMLTAANILYLDTTINRLAPLPVTGLRLPEAAAANRDGIAYTAYDAKNVIQIYVYDLNREEARQVTQNPDGIIRSVVWVEAP